MIFTPEERRAILALLGLLLLGQGVALVRDERKARPDRELSAWLTRAQHARAESLETGAGAKGGAQGGAKGGAKGGAAVAADLAGILPGMEPGLEHVVEQYVTDTSASTFEGDSEGKGRVTRAPAGAEAVSIEEASEVPAGVAATGRVAINRASARDLEGLPGIGPSLAKRIVEEREKSGPFRSPSDLLRVKGIGEKKLAACKDRIDWTS